MIFNLNYDLGGEAEPSAIWSATVLPPRPQSSGGTSSTTTRTASMGICRLFDMASDTLDEFALHVDASSFENLYQCNGHRLLLHVRLIAIFGHPGQARVMLCP